MHDPNFLAEMERTLRELEKELEARIDDAQESEGPMMNSAVGRLSFIDAFQQHQLDLHSHRNMKVQLTSVKAALDRFKAGTYGVCESCETDIPQERLEYLPDTRFCTACNPGAAS